MNKQKTIIADAENYIAKFGRARLTAKEIAYNIHIHPSDLYRFFPEVNGISLKHYLDEKLKSRFLTLIESNNCSVTTISRELGFSSESSFYKWTKRVFGISYKKLTRYSSTTK